MRKTLLSFFALSTLAFNTFAQNPKAAKTNAIIAFEEYMANPQQASTSLGDAKKNIDIAIADPTIALDPKAWLTTGQIYAALGNNDFWKLQLANEDIWLKAYQAFNKVVELDAKKKSKNDVKTGMTMALAGMFNRGVDALNNKSYDQAYNYFANINDGKDKLISYMDGKMTAEDIEKITMMKLSDVNYYAGMSASLSGKVADAEKFLKPIAETGTDEKQVSKAYSLLVDMHRKSDPAKAAEYLKAARAKFPSNQDLLIKSIQIAQEEGKVVELEDDMVAAIKNDPQNASLHVSLAQIYGELYNQKSKSGDAAAADAYYAKAFESYKNTVALDNKEYGWLSNFNMGVMAYMKAAGLHKIVEEIVDMKKYKAKREEMKPSIVATILSAIEPMTKAHEAKASTETANALKSIFTLLDAYEKTPETSAKLAQYTKEWNDLKGK